MKTTDYTPIPGSAPARTIDFLRANPEEFLTADDVAAKFGIGRAGVHTVLARSVDAGLLHRAKDRDGDMVYSLGERAKAGTAPAAAPPPAPPAAEAPADGPRAAPFVLRPELVKVERGVPMPGANSSKGENARTWDATLARLETGDSFALPLAAKASAGKYLARHAKATGRTYATRTVDSGLRIWRTA